MRKADSAHSKYRVDENLRLMLILNSSLLFSKKHRCKVRLEEEEVVILLCSPTHST